MAVSGTDNLQDSWLNRWTLLDLFLVLIIALAVARLWDRPWGILALVAMVLIWQEPGTPRMIWLNLLAVAALLRLLPAEPGRAAMARLRRFLLLYQRGSLVLLAVIAVPFLMEEMRTGIYPQLERPRTLSAQTPAAMAPMPMEESTEREKRLDDLDEHQLMDQAVADGKQQSSKPAKALSMRKRAGAVPEPLSQSLPTPGSNLDLALARLVLVLVLGLKFAGLWKAALLRALATAAVLLVAGLSGIPTPASAQPFPSPELLEALKTRLLEPPTVTPLVPTSPTCGSGPPATH